MKSNARGIEDHRKNGIWQTPESTTSSRSPSSPGYFFILGACDFPYHTLDSYHPFIGWIRRCVATMTFNPAAEILHGRKQSNRRRGAVDQASRALSAASCRRN